MSERDTAGVIIFIIGMTAIAFILVMLLNSEIP